MITYTTGLSMEGSTYYNYSGRYPDSWLIAHFPPSRVFKTQWHIGSRSPHTVAGPSGIRTRFPVPRHSRGFLDGYSFFYILTLFFKFVYRILNLNVWRFVDPFIHFDIKFNCSH